MLIYQGVLDTSFQKDITIITCSCFMFRREDTFSETHRLSKTGRKKWKNKKRTGRYVAYRRLQEIPATSSNCSTGNSEGPIAVGIAEAKKTCGYKPRTKMNKDEQRWTKYSEDNVFWVCLLCGVRFFVTSKGGGTLHQTLHSARKWLTVRSPAGKALRCSFQAALAQIPGTETKPRNRGLCGLCFFKT